MRPIRQVVAPNLRYKFVSIAEDENKLTVRLLHPVPADTANPDVDESLFYSTTSLLYRYVRLDGQLFYITAEGSFDKESRLGAKWWKPGANIEFITNTTLANQGLISVVSKHQCYPNTEERSTEWLKRLGCQGLCQIYCRSSSESVRDAAKSFACDEQGKVYTNMDTARFVAITSDYLEANHEASGFLITHPVLSVPKTVKPEATFECVLMLFRGEDGQVATECTGDWWIVESLAGYVAHRKVVVEQGVGYFTARAMDLLDGDVMDFLVKDQAGYVFCTAKTEIKE